MRALIPSQVLGLLTSGRGVFTARDAEIAGVSADRLQRLTRTGQLERVGRGAYAATEQLAAASPWAAFAIRSRGFVMSRTKLALAADWSAVAL